MRGQRADAIKACIIEGGARHFPRLLGKASGYVQGIDREDVPAEEVWQDFIKGGRSKAILHAVGAVLKPGRPTHASLEGDDGFGGEDAG